MALDLDALESSFDLVAPQGDALVDTFYTRLFAAAPATSRTARSRSTTRSSARC
jgi:hypothetical protein